MTLTNSRYLLGFGVSTLVASRSFLSRSLLLSLSRSRCSTASRSQAVQNLYYFVHNIISLIGYLACSCFSRQQYCRFRWRRFDSWSPWWWWLTLSRLLLLLLLLFSALDEREQRIPTVNLQAGWAGAQLIRQARNHTSRLLFVGSLARWG